MELMTPRGGRACGKEGESSHSTRTPVSEVGVSATFGLFVRDGVLQELREHLPGESRASLESPSLRKRPPTLSFNGRE
jgi:hypothetical protein